MDTPFVETLMAHTEKLRPCEFLGRENSDHGLSLGCFWGRGRRGGSQWSKQRCVSWQSGHIWPRQGTEICNFGAPSRLDFFWNFLLWIRFFPFLQVYCCESAPPLEPPKPRKIQSSSKVTKKWLSGSPPKVTLKVTWKDPESDSKVTFSGQKVTWLTFRVTLGGDLESHFLVTFELLCIFRGFGGSRGGALSSTVDCVI